MDFLYTVVVFLGVLGVLVLVHEYGHFVVARYFGVGIEKFSIGMGPRVAGFTRGETEFVISAIPIGGYVKMEGEVPEDIKPQEELTEEERSRAFTYKPAYQRILISFAGPFLNIVLAIILAPLIYMVGVQVPAYLEKAPVVEALTPSGAAEKAGFQIGDKILTVAGESYSTWEDVTYALALSPGKDVTVSFERDGSKHDLIIRPEVEEMHGIGLPGFSFRDNWYITEVSKDSEADRIGLKANDTILSIDGVLIPSSRDMLALLNDGENAGRERALVVKRGEETFAVNATPRKNEELEKYVLGIGIGNNPEVTLKHFGFVAAVGEGGKFIRKNVFWLGKFFNKLVSGEVSTKLMGGPFAIAKVVGQAARVGLGSLLVLCTLISLQLGILNLLPIPALDGGHILFGTWEIISRRRPNQRFVEITQTIGFSMLLLAIALITVQDIWKEKATIVDFLNRFM